MVGPKRFEVWIVQLNPTVGSEINKIRPCVVVSPDVANMFLNTVTVVPLTSTIRSYPTRVTCSFEGKQGQLAIDQIRSIDKVRLIKRIGEIDIKTSKLLCEVLIENFRY